MKAILDPWSRPCHPMAEWLPVLKIASPFWPRRMGFRSTGRSMNSTFSDAGLTVMAGSPMGSLAARAGHERQCSNCLK